MVPRLPHIVVAQASDVASEDPRDENARSNLLLEHPLDLKHAPVCLNCDSCQSLLLSVFFSFTKNDISVLLDSANKS